MHSVQRFCQVLQSNSSGHSLSSVQGALVRYMNVCDEAWICWGYQGSHVDAGRAGGAARPRRSQRDARAHSSIVLYCIPRLIRMLTSIFLQ